LYHTIRDMSFCINLALTNYTTPWSRESNWEVNNSSASQMTSTF